MMASHVRAKRLNASVKLIVLEFGGDSIRVTIPAYQKGMVQIVAMTK